MRQVRLGPSVLVIASYWPLDFRLAYHAAIWYYKIRNNMAGAALQSQFQRLRDSHSWNSTIFYAPAASFIKTMCQPGEDLVSLPTIGEFRATLRSRIQETLTRLWSTEDKGVWTKQLIPTWSSIPLTSKMYSKTGSVRQLQMISGHFQCNAFRLRTGQTNSPSCRHGCDCDEDITHILHHCPHYSSPRASLLSQLALHDLEPTTKNMLTNNLTTIAVQKFLTKVDIGG